MLRCGTGDRWPAGRPASCPASWPVAGACVSPTSTTTSPGCASASWWPPRSRAPGWRSSWTSWARLPRPSSGGNGPELTSKAMRFRSERSGAELHPARQAHAERLRGGLNGKFRDSCLNQHWFRGLADVSVSSTTGGATATMNGRAAPWAAQRRAERAKQAVPFHSLSNWTCFRGKVSRGSTCHRVIPALAGNTRAGASTARPTTGHPRVGGEH